MAFDGASLRDDFSNVLAAISQFEFMLDDGGLQVSFDYAIFPQPSLTYDEVVDIQLVIATSDLDASGFVASLSDLAGPVDEVDLSGDAGAIDAPVTAPEDIPLV